MALTDQPRYGTPVVPISIPYYPQITSTAASAVKHRVGFACRLVGVHVYVRAIGGSTDPTDVDVAVENGTTDITDAIPVVDDSTLVEGGIWGDPKTAALAKLAEDDILHVDVTVTGGTSPTVDGLVVTLLVTPQ